MSRLFILVLSFVLITSSASAERWVKFDDTTKHVLGKRSGDGMNLGICGENNSNIQAGYIEATESEYQAAGKWKKVDTALPVGSRVIDMPQAEKDVILQAEADAQAQAIEDALQRYEVSNLELLTALVKRINIRLPSNPITKQEIIDEIKDARTP